MARRRRQSRSRAVRPMLRLPRTRSSLMRSGSVGDAAPVRAQPATSCALQPESRGPRGARIAGQALRLDPGLPAHVLGRRRERRRSGPARREAEGWLRRLAGADASVPIRVAAVFPEPTPYRAPLLDRVAAHPEIDLTVVYAAGTVAGRTWRVEPKHRAVVPPRSPRSGCATHPPPRLPVDARRRRRADRDTPVRRRRLGLEHVRSPGRDRLVRDQGRAVRARGREPRRGAACRVAPHREGHGRAARRPAIGGRSRHRHAGARLHDLARRRARARPPLREHRGRRGLRCARGSARSASAGAARRSSGSSPDDVVVLSVARLAPEKGLGVLVASRRRPRAIHGSSSSSPATGRSGRGSSALASRARSPARAASETSTGSGSWSCTWQLTCSRSSPSASHGQSSSTRRRPAGCRSSSRTASGRRTTSCATGRTARSFPPETWAAAATRASRARRGPGAPPRPGRPLARAGARLGLRAERRGIPGCGPGSR